jgi:hypothetical protein
MSKVATTPAKKYANAKCEKCIHFWAIKGTKEAYCTAAQLMRHKTRRKIKNFIECDFYVEA